MTAYSTFSVMTENCTEPRVGFVHKTRSAVPGFRNARVHERPAEILAPRGATKPGTIARLTPHRLNAATDPSSPRTGNSQRWPDRSPPPGRGGPTASGV